MNHLSTFDTTRLFVSVLLQIQLVRAIPEALLRALHRDTVAVDRRASMHPSESLHEIRSVSQ